MQNNVFLKSTDIDTSTSICSLQDTVSQNGEEIEFSVHRGASGDGSGGASEISSLTSFMRHQAVD